MSQDNKKKPLKEFKFKFNFYWVYGILFALILGYQFFNSGDLATKELSANEFETILNDDDIERIVIANDDVAQLYIKSEAIEKEKPDPGYLGAPAEAPTPRSSGRLFARA